MSSSASSSSRIDALDITKGFLVVLMVVYHSLNYSTQYQLAFRFLAFLPPTFILITGFLLSHLYLRRRSADPAQLNRRLLTRGAKLLVLFTVLNVAAQFARSQNYHGPSLGLRQFFAAWPDMYLWGGGRLAAFEILLPIAYLLLLAPLLLWLARANRFALPALCVLVLTTSIMLERHYRGSLNLSLIGVGILGILIGQISPAAINHLSRFLPLSALAYATHITIGAYVGQPMLHQVLGAVIALAVIYGIANIIGSEGWINQRLIRLGQYSLVAYIGQIAFLQLYSHFAGRPEPLSIGLLLMFGLTLAATTLMVEAIEWGKTQSRSFHLLYRTIIP